MNKTLSDNSKFENFGPVDDPKNVNFFIKKKKNPSITAFIMKKKCEIEQELYKKVRSTGAQPSKMYGLAKIHKDPRKPPYRPILSMVGNYKSHLAIELDKLLKPFIPSEYTVY